MGLTNTVCCDMIQVNREREPFKALFRFQIDIKGAMPLNQTETIFLQVFRFAHVGR